MLKSFTAVARVDDLGDGEMKLVEPEGQPIVLAKVCGEYFALSALCSHANGYLDEGTLDGYELECPLHVGRFDLRTGAATQFPAKEPVSTYGVRIEGAVVLVGPVDEPPE